MEYQSHHPKVFILSGKAKSGKNKAADIIQTYYQDKKWIQISYAYYLKHYVKNITGWDGREETKLRDVLQSIGIDLLKNKIDDQLLIRRVCEDIKVYSYFFDIIIITDARMVEEVVIPQKLFGGITVRIVSSYENGLTKEQQAHITETALDTYKHFDYVLQSETLEEDTISMLKEVEKHENSSN